MQFIPGNIDGVYHLRLDRLEDERGFFARGFCAETGPLKEMDFTIHQTNISYNRHARTLRGLHYQAAPKPDPKIVRCLKGRIFDVAVDIRPDSPTYLQWDGVFLDADNRDSLIIPGGCAHGFITMEDDCELLYLMGAPYDGALGRGCRWDDAAFAIDWPVTPLHINDRDAAYPDFDAP